MTDDPTSNTHAQLAEYLRLNPDATAIEAVGHVGADPSRWVDLVEDALAADRPHAALATPDDCREESDAVDDAAEAGAGAGETPDGAEEEGGSDRSTPGVDTKKTGSATARSTGDAATAVRSGRTFYPPTLRDDREWWIDWVRALPLDDDGTPDADATPTKQPVAPYRRGDASPVRWHFGLDADEHPSTSFDRVEPWNGARIGVDVHAPERVISDAVGLGVIIPPDQDERTITLLDWDDVRDPDTGAIHPVAARALDALDSYAEISQSGEGIHQFVFGEIPGGRKKFIRHVDDEPFVGDDRPQIEMYQSGRVCAMTGEHVAGSGDDVADGQDLIDRLCWEFGTASNSATDTPTDPLAHKRGDDDAGDDAGGSTPSHDAVGDALREARAYDGPALDEWDTPEERSIEYDAVLRARERSDELSGIANWELLGYAAALGYRDGLDKATVLEDLREHPTPQYGYDDTRARKEVRGVYRKADAGNYNPPTTERLVERGILPEGAVETGDPVAVLPPGVRDLTTAASGWDWRNASRDTHLTIDAVQERTADKIADAYGSGDRALVEAPPTTGKTFGSILAAARTGEPVSIFTGRGRKEQYDQLKETCEELGLTYRVLPSFTRDCETANGEHGDDWADTVRGWYARGATPKAIHKYAEEVLGRPLPCQAGDGERCSYAAKWDFDPDTDGSADPEEDEPIDVLIGHYVHAHKQKTTAGRTAVFDEFPDGDFETELRGGRLETAVSYWLDATDAVPFDSYTDLVEHRSDESRRADALLWFDEHGIEPDEAGVFDDDAAHALAPVAVFSILASDDLGNGYEHVDLGDGHRAVFDDGRDTRAKQAGVTILRPPALDYASAVVALDGTPTKRLWELALGERRLNHKPVLTDAERTEYLRDTLNLNIVRTTEYVKPYNNGDHVRTDDDAALLDAIADKHGERPGVITTTTALDEYAEAGVLDPVRDEHDALTGDVNDGPADAVRWYGNVLGSNEFKETRLGAVIGSNHYGDQYIKKWAAYDGDGVERGDGKGADLSYSGIGDDVLRHMREHDTLQAAMRFGRDGNGAVVYVHTNTLPDWVPLAGEGRVTRTRTDAERDVLNAAADLEEWRTADLATHPDVSVGERQVFNILNRLAERDDAPIAREYDGRGYTWRDDGLHEVNEHGDVSLDAVDLGDDAREEKVAETARIESTYTWEFLNHAPDPDGERGDPPDEPSATRIDAVGASDSPPDPGD